MYDVTGLRAQFPSLASGIAHFDGPGGTQTPREVGEAIARTLTGPVSNKGVGILSERNATAAITAFREAMGDFLASDPGGIVHGRSATALAYDFAAHLSRSWGPGDEVVVSRLDHDSNVRPWIQAAERVGASVRWIEFDPATTEVDPASVEDAIGPSTVFVAVGAASNLLGTIAPVRWIADLAHEHGALVWVDAVHYAAHLLPDRGALGADFLVCSPYKFLGPHCGVLAADPERLAGLRADKLVPQTSVVPEALERGTLPYETLAGVTAAVDFLAGLADLTGGRPGVSGTPVGTAEAPPSGAGREFSRRARLGESFTALHAHEDALLATLEEGLRDLGDEVVLWSRAHERTPTLLITLPGRDVTEAYRVLARDHEVLAPAGDFYAWETVQRLGLPDLRGLRMGIAPYTDSRDVERLLAGLRTFLEATPPAHVGADGVGADGAGADGAGADGAGTRAAR